jgi:hypothetical protein
LKLYLYLRRKFGVVVSIFQAVDTATGPLFAVVAASLAKWQDRLLGEVTGWSSFG